MHNQGWIKIHRKMLDTSFAKKPTIAWLFLVLILKANHKENKFLFNKEEVTIKSGQLLTGVLELSKNTGLTVMQVRYGLECLKVADTLTIKSTNKFSIITILNYSQYQSNSKQSNKPVTNQQQTSNKPVTTNNTDKKEENERKDTLSLLATFNKTLNTKYKTIPQENLDYWLKIYSLEEIIQAIEKIPQHEYWKDKMSPILLFRRMNPRKESVDYIGELLNRGKKKGILDSYKSFKEV